MRVETLIQVYKFGFVKSCPPFPLDAAAFLAAGRHAFPHRLS